MKFEIGDKIYRKDGLNKAIILRRNIFNYTLLYDDKSVGTFPQAFVERKYLILKKSKKCKHPHTTIFE